MSFVRKTGFFAGRSLEQELDPDGDGLFNTSEMDELDRLFPPPGPHPVTEYGDGSLATRRARWEREGDGFVLGEQLANFAPASASSCAPFRHENGHYYSVREPVVLPYR